MGPIQLGIHIMQSVLAVIILGCSIAGLTHHSSIGFSLAVFTSIATLLVSIYIITASFRAKSLYKLWLVIGLNVFTTVFWVATVGELAVSAGCVSDKDAKHCHGRRSGGSHALRAATLALSVIDGLLSIASIAYTVYSKRDRSSQTPETAEVSHFQREMISD